MEYATDSGKVLFEFLWRTRQGNYVPVNEMEDEHIVNTIDYFQSRVDDPMRGGEPSWTLPITDLHPTQHNIEVLKRELIRRNQASD